MYIFDVISLAETLAEQRLTKKQQSDYLFVWITLICPVFLFVGLRDLRGPGLVPVLQWLASLIIIGVGVSLCFRAMQEGMNRDFVSTFVCLGVPVGMQLLLYAVLPGLILNEVVEKYWGYSLAVYFNPVVQTAYFWRLHHWIGLSFRNPEMR